MTRPDPGAPLCSASRLAAATLLTVLWLDGGAQAPPPEEGPPAPAEARARDAPASVAGPTAGPEQPPLDLAVEEEVVVTGIRRSAPEWRPPPIPYEEEEETDWRRRDETGRADAGRIEMGRASVYQDLRDRRTYEPFRDEYMDPRPPTSFRIRFGKKQD